MTRNSDPWFRFYVRTLNNPKAQRLASGDFKGWVNLLCLAKEYDGDLPPVEDVAFRLRLSKRKVEALLKSLRSNGLVDGDRMHDWDEMQYPSDSSTARVKRHRERKEHPMDVPSNVPCAVSSNVSVTVQRRVEERRVETETEKPPKPPAHKLADVPEGFSHWYDAYPRKRGKHAAIKAWKKIKPSKTAAALMTTAIRNQVDQHHFQNGRGEDYIPNPATWLNQGRWEDELAPPPETSEQSRERAIDEHQVSRRYGRPLKADIAELDKMIETASTNDYLGLASLEAHRQNLIEELDESKENQHDARDDQEPTPRGSGADRPA